MKDSIRGFIQPHLVAAFKWASNPTLIIWVTYINPPRGNINLGSQVQLEVPETLNVVSPINLQVVLPGSRSDLRTEAVNFKPL